MFPGNNGEVITFSPFFQNFRFPLLFSVKFLNTFTWQYRYNLIKEVGDGTFGSVWRAINKQTGEVVSML